MAGSTTEQSTGWTSVALALLVGTSSVLLSHLLWAILLAASFDGGGTGRSIPTTVLLGVSFVVLAGVGYMVLVNSRTKRKLPRDVSGWQALGWTILAVLATSLAYGLFIVVIELQGFGMPVIWFALLHAVPAMPIALVLIPVGVALHRRWLKAEAQTAPLA